MIDTQMKYSIFWMNPWPEANWSTAISHQKNNFQKIL